jgi:hypothetical protein
MLIQCPVVEPTTAEALVAGAGFVLWTAAYGFTIQQGRRDRTYGIPLIAICLNVTWEFYFAVLCPLVDRDAHCYCTSSGWSYAGVVIWFLLDFWILCQLFHYGWRQPALQRHLPSKTRHSAFLAMMAILLLLAFVWQYTFVAVAIDRDGNTLAWVTNLIMSALFVRSALTRPNLRGLSYRAAWAMLFGNLAFVIYAGLNHFAVFTPWPAPVTLALMVAVILFNCFYVLMLEFRRSSGSPNVISPVFP